MALTLDQPPVDDPIVDSNGQLSGVWRDWFSTNIGTILTILSEFGIVLPPITTAERDAIAAPANFQLIGNITTRNPEIFIPGIFPTPGSWKTIVTA